LYPKGRELGFTRGGYGVACGDKKVEQGSTKGKGGCWKDSKLELELPFPLEADELQDRCKMDSDPSSGRVNGLGALERANCTVGRWPTHLEVWLGVLFGWKPRSRFKKYDTGREHAAGQARAGTPGRMPEAPGR
jgi:hypothetical protein